MAKKRKLFQKIISGSRNIRFDEFILLLEGFRFELKRIRGSHHVYKHPSIPALLSVQPTANDQAKPYQIRQFLRLIEEYSLTLNEPELDESDE